ncbi:UNVERIFIED_CONTAM: hypothetical protein K2H54_004702 [Gekko kuhli]
MSAGGKETEMETLLKSRDDKEVTVPPEGEPQGPDVKPKNRQAEMGRWDAPDWANPSLGVTGAWWRRVDDNWCWVLEVFQDDPKHLEALRHLLEEADIELVRQELKTKMAELRRDTQAALDGLPNAIHHVLQQELQGLGGVVSRHRRLGSRLPWVGGTISLGRASTSPIFAVGTRSSAWRSGSPALRGQRRLEPYEPPTKTLLTRPLSSGHPAGHTTEWTRSATAPVDTTGANRALTRTATGGSSSGAGSLALAPR